jgi:pilus assembly protein Flp/PilA
MNDICLKLYVKIQVLLSREEGQELVEYALIVGLICLGASASTKRIGTGLSTAFTTISTNIVNAV